MKIIISTDLQLRDGLGKYYFDKSLVSPTQDTNCGPSNPGPHSTSQSS